MVDFSRYGPNVNPLAAALANYRTPTPAPGPGAGSTAPGSSSFGGDGGGPGQGAAAMMAAPPSGSGSFAGTPGVPSAMVVPSAQAQAAPTPIGLPPGPGVMPPTGATGQGVAALGAPGTQQLPIPQQVPFGFGLGQSLGGGY
jgi:hypothetical protein